VDLPTQGLAAGSEIAFTFYWLDEKRWEGTDFSVIVET
jgi:glucoamylase